MGTSQFLPFYERLSARLSRNIFGRVLISLVLGFAFVAVHFLAVHYAGVGTDIFSDWSWFLGVLISTAMLCLYIATSTLHALLSRLAIYSANNPVYHARLKDTLSDRNFVVVGAFFGTLNCVLGYSFGLPYSNGQAIISILFGYFVVGFIGGMGLLGIFGVFVAMRVFARDLKPSLDFTSPDNCGGTQFIGETLVVFSSVTLIVGVMISTYIIETNWSGHTSGITGLRYFWIVFPYVMSLIILIAPAIPLHLELRQYKLEQEDLFNRRLAVIRQSLEDGQLDGTKRKELRDDHEFGQNARRELYQMRLWPYGIGASSKYIIVLIVNSIATFHSLSGWINSLLILTWR
ncbi:MAG: hypothetical protein WAU57_01180 [Xanthobacteraceae bacterium]